MQGKVLHVDGEEHFGRYFDWNRLRLKTKRSVLEKEKKALYRRSSQHKQDTRHWKMLQDTRSQDANLTAKILR